MFYYLPRQPCRNKMADTLERIKDNYDRSTSPAEIERDMEL